MLDGEESSRREHSLGFIRVHTARGEKKKKKKSGKEQCISLKFKLEFKSFSLRRKKNPRCLSPTC